jgi:hypothetical protein
LTTPGACFFPAFFFWYFWHVMCREWRLWRHLDHRRCLFFFLVLWKCSAPRMEASRPHQGAWFFLFPGNIRSRFGMQEFWPHQCVS